MVGFEPYKLTVVYTVASPYSLGHIPSCKVGSISIIIVLTGQFTRVMLNYKLNFIIYRSNMHSFIF